MKIPKRLKAVPGFYGYYADRGGGIYSARQGSNLRKLSPGPVGWRHVYRGVMISPMRGASFRMYTVHYLVCLTFHGPRPFEGAVVRHLNDDNKDNRALNLAWGSRKDNSEDARRNGKICLGSQRANSKLTESDVLIIKRKLSAGGTRAGLGREFGVAESVIGSIKFGRHWAHVKEEE